MAAEKVDISVLVVDDDEASLAIITDILNSFNYKVLIAKGAANALDILREFQGFLDLVITELQVSGMDGVEFQKRIESDFQLPVIMMSADRSKSEVAKSLTNGATHFILKPFSPDDFKDIWQLAVASKKRKISMENNEGAPQPNGGVLTQDSNHSIPSALSKRKRKHKLSQKTKEGQSEGKARVVKKPKIVWTTHLHNIFLLAIKRIGLDRAVPKRILEVMNVPNLTRENVASHLQKYRIFLRKVAEKGLVEGLSNRDLKSRFASGLSASVIRDFQAASAKVRVPVQQYMKRLAVQSGYGTTTNALKPYNQVSRSDNYMNSASLGRTYHFPYSWHKDLLNMRLQPQNGDSSNQATIGVQSSSFATSSNARAHFNNVQQKMLGSYGNSSNYAKSSSNNGIWLDQMERRAAFPSKGTMGHGLISSANGQKGGVQYGGQQLLNQNYGISLENNHHKFNYDQGNRNIVGSLNNSGNNNLAWHGTTYNSSSNIQQNVGSGSQIIGNEMKGLYNSTVGNVNSVANHNSFGLINNGTTQNANRNVLAPLGQGNSGLAQGGFAFASANSSIVVDYGISNDQLPPTLITNNATRAENVSLNQQLPHQQDVNVARNDNFTSIVEDEFKFNHQQDEVDLSSLFLTPDEPDFFINQTGNINASELPDSDYSNYSQAMQSLEQIREIPNASEVPDCNYSNYSQAVQSLGQCNRGGDVIVNQADNTLNVLKESPTGSDKKCNQLGGYSGFVDMKSLDSYMVDDVSSARRSTNNQDWDMDIIETYFGAETN